LQNARLAIVIDRHMHMTAAMLLDNVADPALKRADALANKIRLLHQTAFQNTQ
jgi:hypothetical protein